MVLADLDLKNCTSGAPRKGADKKCIPGTREHFSNDSYEAHTNKMSEGKDEKNVV